MSGRLQDFLFIFECYSLWPWYPEVFFTLFILFGVYWTFWIWKSMSFNTFGNIWSIISSNIFSAAAAAKSCPILCNPIDGSPPGSPVPGILQARALEWVAISFSNSWKWKKWKWSRSVISDSLGPHGLQPNRLLRPLDFPGKSTGVGAIAFSDFFLTYSHSCLLVLERYVFDLAFFFFFPQITKTCSLLKNIFVFPIGQYFSIPAQLTFWARSLVVLCGKGFLCVVRCLAASLTSTTRCHKHSLPVVTTKMSPNITKYLLFSLFIH